VEATRATPLRQLYPQLAQVRVEFEFQDGTERSPSPQAFTYFPAARGFFRYACPCHSCNGEFDLSGHVAELAGRAEAGQRSRRVSVPCTGQRARSLQSLENCPISATVRVSALHRAAD
jgi:hypothetical protein